MSPQVVMLLRELTDQSFEIGRAATMSTSGLAERINAQSSTYIALMGLLESRAPR